MSGWAAALVDLDNDGLKDLLTANSHANDRIEEFEATSYRQTNGVFRNLGGKFEDVARGAGEDFSQARANRGFGIGDLDGDGRLDLVLTVLGDRAQVLRNVSPEKHWLTLRLEGHASARDGIGAKVRIGQQSDHMTTAVGYASSSDFGVHFGLGAASVADRVEIAWPSGTRQVLEHVKADQVVTVTENREP